MYVQNNMWEVASSYTCPQRLRSAARPFDVDPVWHAACSATSANKRMFTNTPSLTLTSMFACDMCKALIICSHNVSVIVSRVLDSFQSVTNFRSEGNEEPIKVGCKSHPLHERKVWFANDLFVDCRHCKEYTLGE